jgi:hypothetical protein
VCGVTLSFCPGSGSNPANKRMTIATMATMTQVVIGLRVRSAMVGSTISVNR